VTWKTIKLRDCARIVSGSTPKTNIEEYWGGDILWVTPKVLSNLSGKYISSTPDTITQLGYDSCSTILLPSNSVILSSRAPIGLVAINSVPMATNQGFKSFIPDKKILDSSYLYYWLKAHTEYLQHLGRGATFKEISKRIVEEIEIPLPPLEEQRRIAAILDCADTLRAKRRAALAKLDTLLQATFIDMFGDPVTNPMGWEVKQLDDVINFKTGKLDSNAAVEGGQYPFFTCAREVFEIDRYAFDEEALLMAGNNASADYWVKHYAGKFNAYQRTYVMTLKMVGLSYKYMRLAMEYKLSELKRISKGSNTRYLTLAILRPIRIQIPSHETMQRFDKVHDQITKRRHQMERGLMYLDALFDSLQQRAFRGELSQQGDRSEQLLLFAD